MQTTRVIIGVALIACAWGTSALRGAQQASNPVADVAIDADDIGGTVRGPNGPEAGVWVIAETSDLPTKFRKIVVTDDQGRYVIPDLPTANYEVWVRGYGLVDSAHVSARPGRQLALTAVAAPSLRAAAEYYPASYWLSLVDVPPKSAFPLPGPPAGAQGGRAGGPAPRAARNQHEWIAQLKAPCQTCHQMGTKATREIPKSLGTFDSPFTAWDRRLRAGQFGRTHQSMNVFGGYERGVAMYADWTDRILAGEIPTTAPARPRGVERNVVITLWDHSGPLAFVHDVIATDRRNPRINANGIIYGGEFNYNALTAVDPVKHTAEMIEIPTVVEKSRIRRMSSQTMEFPSPYWGEEIIWQEWAQPNNLIIDQDNRVWTLATMRPPEENPRYCTDGSRNPFARAWPQKTGGRQLAMYDPKTKKFTHVDTCFNLHHIVFAEDRDNTIFASGNGSTIGWINTRVFLETRSAERAQGWCPAYYDVNGDGRIDPKVDKKVDAGSYGIAYNPADGSIWFASLGTPGKILRLVRGANPPDTCVYEAYEPPFNNPKAPGKTAYFPRGIDVDRNGIVWTALAGSGHIASFDRKKCTVLAGEAATTGQHCPEGWTLYSAPGARFRGTSVTDDVNAEFFYYNWVDQFDTFGLGANVPLAAGTGSDSLMAVLPKSGEVVTFRVPYPMGGFFARSMDGRIDDPNTGWKGRGLWAPNASRPTWHQETGKGSPSFVAHFQLRPDPLAK